MTKQLEKERTEFFLSFNLVHYVHVIVGLRIIYQMFMRYYCIADSKSTAALIHTAVIKTKKLLGVDRWMDRCM